MRHRRSRTWALPVLAAVALAGCTADSDDTPSEALPDTIAGAGSLLVATDPTFPPAQLRATVEFRGVQRGQVTGFEAELVEAVADELGVDVAWVDVPFDQVLDRVAAGSADMGASAITVTDEREADFEFVPFFQTGTRWAAREPNQAGVSPNNACGARVAVQIGTVQADDVRARSEACEEAGDEPIDVREFERQDEATAAVLAGTADAFVADAPAVQWALRQSGGSPSAAGTSVTGRLVAIGDAYDVAPYGWAVTDDTLATALREALLQVVDSGDYAEILDFWGVSAGALDSEAIEGSGDS